jgi:hypothetical protein
MTPLTDIYDAFLAKVTDDEWGLWDLDEVYQDLEAILKGAISFFRFPKNSLEIITVEDEKFFINKLTGNEIQILATYMKCEWLNRCILSWENIKPLYEEKDFSQANLLDKLYKGLEFERKTAKELESYYYRTSDSGSIFDYSKLAGGI